MFTDTDHPLAATIKAHVEGYGTDPWIFIRELFQNARDAGAERIDVSWRVDKGLFRINVHDNGSGMSKQDAQNYLFRLFASSKESKRGQLGRFGIGFWTILLIRPVRILLQSVSRKDAPWAVEISPDLCIRETEPSSPPIPHGTLISLFVQGPQTQLGPLLHQASTRYGCTLRRQESRRPLPVWFQQNPIPHMWAFSSPWHWEGRSAGRHLACGLGPFPRISLYTGGLLLWEGPHVSGLLGGAGHNIPSESGMEQGGLHLQMRIDDPRLEPTLERTLPRDTQRLRETLAIARQKGHFFFHRLHKPRFLPWLLASILCIPLLILVRHTPSAPVTFNSTQTVPHPLTRRRYQGATTPDVPEAVQALPWGRYTPPQPILFTLQYARFLDPEAGLIARDTPEHVPFKLPSDALHQPRVQITLNLPEGTWLLPVPSGGQADFSSLAPHPVPFCGGWYTALSRPTQLSYNAILSPSHPDLDPEVQALCLQIPNEPLTLPKGLEQVLDALAHLPVPQRVSALPTHLAPWWSSTSWTDCHPLWQRLLGSGRTADCDSANTLGVYLLRRWGVPSQLNVGLRGVHGQFTWPAHGWCSFFLEGTWQTLDLTPSSGGAQEAVQGAPSSLPHQQQEGFWWFLLPLLPLMAGTALRLIHNQRFHLGPEQEQTRMSLLEGLFQASPQQLKQNPLAKVPWIPDVSARRHTLFHILQSLREGKLFWGHKPLPFRFHDHLVINPEAPWGKFLESHIGPLPDLRPYEEGTCSPHIWQTRLAPIWRRAGLGNLELKEWPHPPQATPPPIVLKHRFASPRILAAWGRESESELIRTLLSATPLDRPSLLRARLRFCSLMEKSFPKT